MTQFLALYDFSPVRCGSTEHVLLSVKGRILKILTEVLRRARENCSEGKQLS